MCEIVELAMYFGDAFLDSQDGVDGGRAQATDQTGLDGFELPKKEGRAGFDFVLLRRAISGRAALDDVADVNLFAFHADRLDHAVQKLAGAAHKRQALLVFVGARPFSNKHQFSVRIPFAKNYGLAAAGELAAPAIAQVLADLLQRFGAVGFGGGVSNRLKEATGGLMGAAAATVGGTSTRGGGAAGRQAWRSGSSRRRRSARDRRTRVRRHRHVVTRSSQRNGGWRNRPCIGQSPWVAPIEFLDSQFAVELQPVGKFLL